MATPTRRERTRPAELVLLSLGFAVFTGLVVFLSTRDFVPSIIFLGIVFIVSLVVLAMLALTAKPNKDEEIDLGEQDRAGH